MSGVLSAWCVLLLWLSVVGLADNRKPRSSRSLGFGLKPSRQGKSSSSSGAEDPFSQALREEAQEHWDSNPTESVWKNESHEESSHSTSASSSSFAAHHPASDDILMQSNLLQVPCGLQHQHEEDFDTKISPVAAFVDTGAQVTVLSKRAASRAGLLHLLDRRYAGHATGVGQCRVLGRIPARTLLIHMGDALVEGPAITVLESTGTDGVDLLLGLDFLRDHQAILSLYEEEMKLFCDTNTPVVIPFVRPRRQSPNCSTSHRRRHGSSLASEREPLRTPGSYLLEEEHQQEPGSYLLEEEHQQQPVSTTHHEAPSYHPEYNKNNQYQDDEDEEHFDMSDENYREEDYHERVDLSGV